MNIQLTEVFFITGHTFESNVIFLKWKRTSNAATNLTLETEKGILILQYGMILMNPLTSYSSN